FGQVSLTAVKRAILSKVSRELRDDAIISIADHTASRMGFEFALSEDADFIDGDATSTYHGEMGLKNAIGAGGVSTAATGHDTWPELDMADFTACMGKLPSKYATMTAWVCSANFYYSTMLRVQAAGGGNTIASLQGGDGGRPLFLGKPVYFTDYMPTTTSAATVCTFYGNFGDAVMIGNRQDFEFAMSDQRYFAEDLIGLRGITRFDINVHEPGDASNAGAYVALKTAA
ncbi:MAG: phage major capsid protein, partial [Pirellulales bacterium]|nr:phage major capsid protein [Pirellulales bacterium]